MARNEQPTVTPIKMRIMGNPHQIETLVDEMVSHFDKLQLIERSKPYPCRPPDEEQVRVYLTFVSITKL